MEESFKFAGAVFTISLGLYLITEFAGPLYFYFIFYTLLAFFVCISFIFLEDLLNSKFMAQMVLFSTIVMAVSFVIYFFMQ